MTPLGCHFSGVFCPINRQLLGGHHARTIGLSVLLRCLLRATYPGACGSASGFFSPSCGWCRLGLLCRVVLKLLVQFVEVGNGLPIAGVLKLQCEPLVHRHGLQVAQLPVANNHAATGQKCIALTHNRFWLAYACLRKAVRHGSPLRLGGLGALRVNPRLNGGFLPPGLASCNQVMFGKLPHLDPSVETGAARFEPALNLFWG